MRAVPQFLYDPNFADPGQMTVENDRPSRPGNAERAARAFRAAYARCILTWLPQSAIEHHRRTWLREAS